MKTAIAAVIAAASLAGAAPPAWSQTIRQEFQREQADARHEARLAAKAGQVCHTHHHRKVCHPADPAQAKPGDSQAGSGNGALSGLPAGEASARAPRT